MSINNCQDSTNLIKILIFTKQSTQIEHLDQACDVIGKETNDLALIESHSKLKQIFTQTIEKTFKLLKRASLELSATKALKHQVLKNLPEDPILMEMSQLWIQKRCVQKFFLQHLYSLTINYLNQNLLKQTKLAGYLIENTKENNSASARLEAATSIDTLFTSIEENLKFTGLCDETLSLRTNPASQSTICYEETALWLYQNYIQATVPLNVRHSS
jgi:hypothetical protein